MTHCAVCETAIRKDEASGKTTHLGVPYYFCSEKCEKTFETHRAKYVTKAAKTA